MMYLELAELHSRMIGSDALVAFDTFALWAEKRQSSPAMLVDCPRQHDESEDTQDTVLVSTGHERGLM